MDVVLASFLSGCRVRQQQTDSNGSSIFSKTSSVRRTHCIVFCSCFRSFKNDYILAGTVNNVGRTIPYCGNRDPFALIIETNFSNPVGILFQSNDDLAEQGFNASYFAVDNTQKLCKCVEKIK